MKDTSHIWKDCSPMPGGCHTAARKRLMNWNTRQGQILFAGDLNSGSGAQVNPG